MQCGLINTFTFMFMFKVPGARISIGLGRSLNLMRNVGLHELLYNN